MTPQKCSLGALKVTLAKILALIDDAFPAAPRPEIAEFAMHQEGCGSCECLLEQLGVYGSAEFTPYAIQYLFGDLSTLSPKASVWVLSAYLRQLLLDPYAGLVSSIKSPDTNRSRGSRV